MLTLNPTNGISVEKFGGAIMYRPILTEMAIELWDKDLYSLQMIGDVFGVTRQAVKKYLNKRGISTAKGKREVICDYCGKIFKRAKCYLRVRRKNYCCSGHYHAVVFSPEYIENRYSCKAAKKVVMSCGYHVDYDKGEVVHHRDGNQGNNDPMNLLVFRSNADHGRWHRAGGPDSGVVPVWP